MHLSTVLMNVTLIPASLSQVCLLPAVLISSMPEGPALISSPAWRPSEKHSSALIADFSDILSTASLKFTPRKYLSLHVLHDQEERLRNS